MPFNPAQLAAIGYTSIPFYAKNEPIDQVNTIHPLFNALVKNKEEAPGGNEFYVEQIYTSNDSNGQNYFGADQVSYNERDNVRNAKYPWFNYHNGFGFDEDTLKANGIIVTDDREAVASEGEKVQLTNRLKTAYKSMKLGTQEDLDLEYHLDGSQSTRAVPGLDHLVSLTPNVGIIGGLDAATAAYWRNNTALNISTATPEDGTINAAMQRMYRANTLYGGRVPNLIICGQDYLEALEHENKKISHTNVEMSGSGTSYDGAVKNTTFKGIPVQWDPTFDKIDALFAPATPWRKRCYMLNTDALKLRPVSGFWMLNRKPPRMPDRYVHYWAMTSSYRLTMGQRNAQAVLTIA
jgi:hypothetical protein